MTADPVFPDSEPLSVDSLPTQREGSGRAEAKSHAESAKFAEFDPRSEASLPTMRPGSVPDAIGRIDQYEILRKLGGGGFGVVYLASDTVSGVDVALKTLHPLLKTSVEEMDLLREKFALVSRLAHPNIASPLVLHPCQRIEIWDDEARRELRLSPRDSVMVMRYAPGVTLSRWRRQFAGGVVPHPIALEVSRQIASALDYAHSEKIVHRDVKPSNVMIETVAAEPRPLDHGHGAARSPGAPQRGGGLQTAASAAPSLRVRILDFGLAAEIRSSMSRVSTEQGDTSGTRPYMAPEQWLGKTQDGRTDQYALACVIYELLSGAPPFSGVFETGDATIMVHAVTTGTPDALENVPDCMNDALSRALAKDRAERFPSCTAFVDALGGLESASPLPNPADKAGWRSSDRPQSPSGVSEADVLRKKLALSRAVKAIPAEDRSDAEFGKLVARAEDELAVAEEACKFGRFVTADESLDAAQSALDELSSSKSARRAREEAERKAREEAARKAREEAERKAREEAARKAREKAERKAREEAARKIREKAERKTQEAANAGGKTNSKSPKFWRRWLVAAILVIVAIIGVAIFNIVGCLSSSANLNKPSPDRHHEEAADSQNSERAIDHDGVQLWKDGPFWATTNIGAEKPEDYGLYFWWGDTVGYSRSGARWVASDGSNRNFSFSDSNTSTYKKSDSELKKSGWLTPEGVLAPQHDAARVHWGGAWRMPTAAELQVLVKNCEWSWTTQNGTNGYVVRGRGAYSSASIFLPTAGNGAGPSLYGAKSTGGCWSSIPLSDSDHARHLTFDYSGYRRLDVDYRNFGLPIRPVQGFAK